MPYPISLSTHLSMVLDRALGRIDAEADALRGDALGCSPLAREVTVREVDGDHESVLRAPSPTAPSVSTLGRSTRRGRGTSHVAARRPCAYPQIRLTSAYTPAGS